MTTTPVLGAPELVSGQAAPETTVNEQGRYYEQGAGFFRFLSREETAPPGSPADGDCYLVADSATGAWSGHDGEIAFRMSTGWLYITPREGHAGYVVDESDVELVNIQYDGAAWIEFAGGGGDGVQLPADIDASTDPAYPESTAGQSYRVSTAGTVGGRIVEEGDWIICRVDSEAGTQVEVGANFFVIQGDLTVSNNEEMNSGEADAPSTTMPVTEAAVVGYIESLDLGPQSIQELLSTLPPNDVPEDPQPIINGSVPIYRDDSPAFWETTFSVEAGHVLGTVYDVGESAIETNFYHIGVIFDEGLGNVKGNLPFRDDDFWDVLAPPPIDATQYVLSITDGVFTYIDADSVGSSYTNENAQDAVGGIVDTTLVYTDATPLLSRAALTGAITASEGSNTTALGSFTKSQLDTAVSDGNVLYVGDAYVPGGTDVALADGGTGASTASGARTNLAAAAQTQTEEGIAGYLGSVTNKDYRLVVKMMHAGTITEVTTRSESGTCTATFKINTTALGGSANSVSSSEQSQSHSSSNAFAAGDDIVMTISSNSLCTGLSFSVKYSRTLL